MLCIRMIGLWLTNRFVSRAVLVSELLLPLCRLTTSLLTLLCPSLLTSCVMLCADEWQLGLLWCRFLKLRQKAGSAIRLTCCAFDLLGILTRLSCVVRRLSPIRLCMTGMCPGPMLTGVLVGRTLSMIAAFPVLWTSVMMLLMC